MVSGFIKPFYQKFDYANYVEDLSDQIESYQLAIRQIQRLLENAKYYENKYQSNKESWRRKNKESEEPNQVD